MRVAFDIEANGLKNPTQIWVVVCKDLDTGKVYVFRNITSDNDQLREFLAFSRGVNLWVGHNVLDYDFTVLSSLVPDYQRPDIECIHDTLILSRLIDYPRDSHSLEDYGLEFGVPKGFKVEDGSTLESKHFPIWFYQQYSKDLENYCVRDVEITELVYRKYRKYLADESHHRSILMEHRFQLVVNDLHENGFAFNVEKAQKLLGSVEKELSTLDVQIKEAFPPRTVVIREFSPKSTKFGTISKTSVPRVLHDRIHEYEIGKTYQHTKQEAFNPSSHKQLINVLSEAGWKPTDKTTTHIALDRELNRLKFQRNKDSKVDLAIQECHAKKVELERTGWKINENNLSTLPEDAPAPARLLARRILLEARRRTLVEWLGLVEDDGRIHGKFVGIGAWTHRMAHQNPNTANIPTDAKLFGHEMRALWRAPRNRLLVGVDAESIQLRIFAHYINDPEFTRSLVEGKKDDKSDPHSLNQRILGAKTRNHAKRFIFAYLLGAGVDKLAQILECSREDGEAALNRLVERYSGLATLKETVIPQDAKRGWFIGLDGRAVRIPGETPGTRKHLAMSGYLQNGEAVVMKMACLRWYEQLRHAEKYDEELRRKLRWYLVNFVHDEWQTEVNNDFTIAKFVAKIQADALKAVGEELNLNCPLAGSYWNDDAKDFTIGTNWSQTH